MTQYNKFAPFYDHVVGPRDDVAELLYKMIKRYCPKARSVLELGCGSGSMLKKFSQHFSTTGIDNSQEMLRLARKKAPRARTFLGDITKFTLEDRFDAIVCPFDTINHVTEFSKWKGLFERAHHHLNPGGVFIFDVNTEHKMEEYRLDPVTADVEDNVVSMVQVERVRRYRYNVILRLFERSRGRQFTLHEMILPELVVPTPKILKELANYFRSVTLLDPDRGRPSAYTEELYFACRNPR